MKKVTATDWKIFAGIAVVAIANFGWRKMQFDKTEKKEADNVKIAAAAYLSGGLILGTLFTIIAQKNFSTNKTNI